MSVARSTCSVVTPNSMQRNQDVLTYAVAASARHRACCALPMTRLSGARLTSRKADSEAAGLNSDAVGWQDHSAIGASAADPQMLTREGVNSRDGSDDLILSW